MQKIQVQHTESKQPEKKKNPQYLLSSYSGLFVQTWNQAALAQVAEQVVH